MATIRDVAKRAGVSTATVSHVINGTRPVAEKTRNHVLQVMKELNFVPSALGRGLRKNTLRTIGFIAADMANPFFAQVFRGVETVARAAHYTVIVSHSDEDTIHEEEAIQNLVAKGVDGILLAPVRTENDDTTFYSQIPVPVVTFDRQLTHLAVPAVTTDSQQAVFEAVEFFKKQGHKRFGFITGRQGLSTTKNRLEGFLKATEHAERCIFHGDSRYDGGVKAAHWLAQHPNMPTVVVISNNLMAMGLVYTMQHNYSNQLASLILVTLDDEPWTSFIQPPLSVISQPTHDIGRTAVELLLKRITGIDVPLCTTLPCTFIPRLSPQRNIKDVSQGCN